MVLRLLFVFFLSSCASAANLLDSDADRPSDAGTESTSSSGDGATVGAPCIPSDEGQPYFSGYELTEVALEPHSPRCGGDTCLGNHFQGRTTCPYGQSEAEAKGEAPRAESQLCHVRSGTGPDSRVAVAVLPQLAGRRPADAVYCSCRCAGPDPAATYCACPVGFQCTDLVPSFGFDDWSELEGAYCIKSGTAYQGNANYGPPCQAGDAGELHCGSYDGR